jgi:hypothetical protein
MEVFMNMPKKNRQNKKQPKNSEERKTGFGDKKLEGENRPAE